MDRFDIRHRFQARCERAGFALYGLPDGSGEPMLKRIEMIEEALHEGIRAEDWDRATQALLMLRRYGVDLDGLAEGES